MIKLNNNKDLADWLGIKYKYLTYILYKKRPEFSYNSFEIPKKNGGIRKIYAPDDDLKEIQLRILNNLNLEKEIIDNNRFESTKSSKRISYGFEKDFGIYDNAKNHVNKLFVLNVDIEDFFESFNFGRVRGYFIKNRNFLFHENVATSIAQLTCYEGRLPQGAPTSPIISNLIFAIVDNRIAKLTAGYKLEYSRYADDLTFSTNDRNFQGKYEKFLSDLQAILEHSGFQINQRKTRFQERNRMQEVTGLTVNRKVNVPKKYYKETRAMANNLYRTGEFYINEQSGSLNQLQGKFLHILNVNKKTNLQSDIYGKKWLHKYNDKEIVTNRERDYIKFLFYKLFFTRDRPLIITEGKTDQRYIIAALKKMCSDYPMLIDRDSKQFKILFFKRTQHIEKYLNIPMDGAGAIRNIINFYYGLKGFPNLTEQFNLINANPVILLVDNETKADYPLKHIIDSLSKEQDIVVDLNAKYFTHLTKNLYLVTVPKTNSNNLEIEGLFRGELLTKEINGRAFFSSSKDRLSKNDFSNYVLKNYQNIDFGNFVALLDIFEKIIKEYPTKLTNLEPPINKHKKLQ